MIADILELAWWSMLPIGLLVGASAAVTGSVTLGQIAGGLILSWFLLAILAAFGYFGERD